MIYRILHENNSRKCSIRVLIEYNVNVPEPSAPWWQKYELKFEITSFRAEAYWKEKTTIESSSQMWKI